MDKLITIYHGSEKIIEQPIFGEGKKIMILVLDFTVRQMKLLLKNGPCLHCAMVFQTATH